MTEMRYGEGGGGTLSGSLIKKRSARPPAEGVREAPFKLSTPQDDGFTLDGWGAVFGRETVIDSWEGRFREKIALGSMKRSFQETPPRIQFDHGRHPFVGSIPIARLERIAEEIHPDFAPEGGAHITGRIFDNWMMHPVRDAIAAGAVDGMSFRFEVMQETWENADGQQITDGGELARELERTWRDDVPDHQLPLRTLRQLKVPEMGPVVWPAYKETSVNVRSKIIDLGRLREPEQRRLLAEAMYIADAIDLAGQDAQRATVKAGEHADHMGQPPTLEAGPHPESDSGEQRATVSAGPHPSPPSVTSRNRRAIDVMIRRARDVLVDIDRKDDGNGRHRNHPNPGRRPSHA